MMGRIAHSASWVGRAASRATRLVARLQHDAIMVIGVIRHTNPASSSWKGRAEEPMGDLGFVPTKLQEVLAYIVIHSQGERGSIELAKLAYLVDVESQSLLGRTMTGEVYARAPKGPLPRSFRSALQGLLGHEIARSEGASGGFTNSPKHCHTPGPKPRFTPLSDRTESAIVTRVLARYGMLSPIALQQAAYDTPPMKKEGLGAGDDLDFRTVPADPVFSKWKGNLRNGKWRDASYVRLLKEERAETQELLADVP